MSRKRAVKLRNTSTRKDNVYELSEALINNYKAWEEGPQKRKTWSKHDIRQIKPLTMAQEDFFHAYYSGSNVVAYGSSGTGKTLLALYLAMNDIIDKNQPQSRIIIVRSNVATREVGHLPGTYEEKMSPFEAPYRDICEFLVGKSSTYDDMKSAGLIEFMPTSYVRGCTWTDAIVIVDETQSMNLHEASSIITRLGDNSRLLVLGDIKQDDLIYKKNDKSGFAQALKAFELMPSVAMVKFTQDDIVRSGLVKEWIIALEQLT